jgi:hypothetical protein
VRIIKHGDVFFALSSIALGYQVTSGSNGLFWVMEMKSITSILVSLLTSNLCFATACKLTYFRQSAFEKRVDTEIPEMRDFSKSVNNILKKSYNVLEKADNATLGLVAAIASGGIPIDHFKPEQWDKLNISGNLIYQDRPFSGTALKGIKMTFTEKDNSRTITTGSYGEFSESFSKLVPYSRFRLFSAPFFEMGNKSVPTIKIPIALKIESKICTAETIIDEIPLEPLVFILSTTEKKD